MTEKVSRGGKKNDKEGSQRELNRVRRTQGNETWGKMDLLRKVKMKRRE